MDLGELFRRRGRPAFVRALAIKAGLHDARSPARGLGLHHRRAVRSGEAFTAVQEEWKIYFLHHQRALQCSGRRSEPPKHTSDLLIWHIGGTLQTKKKKSRKKKNQAICLPHREYSVTFSFPRVAPSNHPSDQTSPHLTHFPKTPSPGLLIRPAVPAPLQAPPPSLRLLVGYPGSLSRLLPTAVLASTTTSRSPTALYESGAERGASTPSSTSEPRRKRATSAARPPSVGQLVPPPDLRLTVLAHALRHGMYSDEGAAGERGGVL